MEQRLRIACFALLGFLVFLSSLFIFLWLIDLRTDHWSTRRLCALAHKAGMLSECSLAICFFWACFFSEIDRKLALILLRFCMKLHAPVYEITYTYTFHAHCTN